MPETPQGPEYYSPPSEPTPTPPPPPSISDAANQWTLQQQGVEPSQNPPLAPPAPYGYSTSPSGSQKQGLAITALVLGIVGLVSGWLPVWGVLVGVLAVVFGGFAVAKKQSKPMAISGIVMGVVSIVMSAIVLVFIVIGMRAYEDGADDWFTYGPVASGGEMTLGPEPVDGGLAVADYAFAPNSWDEGTTWFVVILDNPSSNPYPSAQLTVNALDASGNVIDSYWTYQALPSGESAIAGSFYELEGAEVDTLQVVGPDANGLASEPASGTLTVSNMTATSDDLFTTVTGTVTSSFTEEVLSPTVTVVARDASGEIIGAAPGWSDTLDPGQSVPFDAMFYEVMPEGTVYEAYWTSY
ncbi:MAG: DUF4190 domain-containing protein [Demequina sp.]|nr:DUF4190 domain-containing protein [Demequina sp.]